MADNFEKFCDEEEGYATELEWLKYFAHNADFGPADYDVHIGMENRFEAKTGKKVPRGWTWKEDD